MKSRARLVLCKLSLISWAVLLAAGTLFGGRVKDVAVPIQIVTPRNIVEDVPLCGRALTDLLKIPKTPALDVTHAAVLVPESANTPDLMDHLKFRFGGGPLQPGSGQLCFADISELGKAASILYDDRPVQVMNGDTPAPSFLLQSSAEKALRDENLKRSWDSVWAKKSEQPGGYWTSPLHIPGEVQTFRGDFDGKGPGTSVDAGGKPGLILAETPTSLYWMLPEDTPHGSISITLRDAGRGATFPVYILGLAMSANRLKLLRGESTRMQAVVFGPDLLPDEAWTAGDVSDVIDLDEVARLFPKFKIPKPGQPGVIFFRLDNLSRDTVSMKPSKNESFVVNLDRGDFAGKPYTYTGTIQSHKAGGFRINGVVVAFFAPIPGTPLPPGPP